MSLVQFRLAEILVSFGMRQSEVEATASCRNGVVSVNGARILDPNKQYPLVLIEELQCGKHKILMKKTF